MDLPVWVRPQLLCELESLAIISWTCCCKRSTRIWSICLSALMLLIRLCFSIRVWERALIRVFKFSRSSTCGLVSSVMEGESVLLLLLLLPILGNSTGLPRDDANCSCWCCWWCWWEFKSLSLPVFFISICRSSNSFLFSLLSRSSSSLSDEIFCECCKFSSSILWLIARSLEQFSCTSAKFERTCWISRTKRWFSSFRDSQIRRLWDISPCSSSRSLLNS